MKIICQPNLKSTKALFSQAVESNYTMKYLLICVLLFSSVYSYGCICATPETKKEVEEMIRHADIVVEGTYFSSIHHNFEKREEMLQRKRGIDVLFKVSSIIKGNLKDSIIAINQWGVGNCSQIFTFEDRYIIVGYEIKGFQSKREEFLQSIKYKYTEPPLPPPDETDENSILISLMEDKEATDFWQNLLGTYRVFSTSWCSTFDPKSKIGRMIKR
jgi:hypothetical protein